MVEIDSKSTTRRGRDRRRLRPPAPRDGGGEGDASTPARPHQANPFRLYRVGRLAELFDVDRTTIWRWERAGVLPAFVQIGGVRGLTEAQFAELLKERSEAAS
jgi:hypothetical protein